MARVWYLSFNYLAGLALFSISCSMYSTVIDKLITRFKAKPIYVGGQLVYSVSMLFMALARSKWAAIVFSLPAGIMYATMFTMPYLLVAHYHELNCVRFYITGAELEILIHGCHNLRNTESMLKRVPYTLGCPTP